MAMTVKIDKKKLIVEIDLCTPHPSQSGKTMLRATTGGAVKTEVMIDGQPLTVALNAYTSNKNAS